jgi:DNA polymerase-3 subunit epsilon
VVAVSFYICLDTETTGASPVTGHKIIDLACVEIINGVIGKNYQTFLNPERSIDAGAQAVHGISIEFLADKPKFPEIVNDFLAFIEGGVLVIHNAPFDLKFLNKELSLCNISPIQNEIIDTLTLARKKHPGEKASLDALCKKFEIDTSSRILHGALTDSLLLAQVFQHLAVGFEVHARQVKHIVAEAIRQNYENLEMQIVA